MTSYCMAPIPIRSFTPSTRMSSKTLNNAEMKVEAVRKRRERDRSMKEWWGEGKGIEEVVTDVYDAPGHFEQIAAVDDESTISEDSAGEHHNSNRKVGESETIHC